MTRVIRLIKPQRSGAPPLRNSLPTMPNDPYSVYDVRHTIPRTILVSYDHIKFKEDAMLAEKKTVTKDTLIGDAIKNVPGAKAVIEKYFGNGCFTCPGINVESISFGAMMHNLDPDKVVAEINAAQEG